MGQPAKVLWISCVGEKGGAEVYMINFLRHLDRGRFDPHVALLRPGPLADELRGLGFGVYVFPTHRMRNAAAVGRAILQLRALVRRDGFSLVHSNGFRAHVYGGLAARLAGVPEVWSVHTVERPGLSTRAILRLPTTHVTANCERTADYFAAQGLPVDMIWPPVDVAGLADATPRDVLAARYGLPAAGRWIGLGARL